MSLQSPQEPRQVNPQLKRIRPLLGQQTQIIGVHDEKIHTAP